MLINKNTKIIGNKVILVPYCREHVLKYHQWLQSEELQMLTCSMPLTIEKEYEMQQSWQVDKDKLTFIVLDKQVYEQTHDEIASMIGDTNLFILSSEDSNVTCDDNKLIAEPEIMIAEPSARGKGCGLEAMTIMLNYGIEKLKIQQFIAKIVQGNDISVQMFKKLGFVETNFSEVFKEVSMELCVNEKVSSYFKEHMQGVEIKDYA